MLFVGKCVESVFEGVVERYGGLCAVGEGGGGGRCESRVHGVE